MKYLGTAALLATVLVACNPSFEEASRAGAPAAINATQHTSAVLFVERSARAGSTEAPNTHIGARVAQYSGLAGEMLPELLGTPRLPETVGCTERSGAAMGGVVGRAEVRLLDVGVIEVHAGDHPVRLLPRRFPDLWNVVSGVIYATDDELPASDWRFRIPAGTLGGDGGRAMPGFEVEARAPEALSNVSIAEQTVQSGSTVMVPHRAFSVRWNRGDVEDLVVLTFESEGDRADAVSCAVRDEGALEVDGVWAERIAGLSRGGASFTVHRLRSRPFAWNAVETARVVFDVSIRGRADTE